MTSVSVSQPFFWVSFLSARCILVGRKPMDLPCCCECGAGGHRRERLSLLQG